jgi:hypothetical protein
MAAKAAIHASRTAPNHRPFFGFSIVQNKINPSALAHPSLRAQRRNPETRRDLPPKKSSLTPHVLSLTAVLAAMFLHQSTACAAPQSTIPFIGCATTGMVGGPPPSAPPVRIDLPAPIAAKLAVFGGARLAVLAPRGWNCTAHIGTSGSSLTIFPGSQYEEGGPAIAISSIDGGNLGAADFVIAFGGRFFPKFVSQKNVNAFFFDFPFDRPPAGEPLIFPIRPRDRLRYISPEILAFETPAEYPGLGASLIPSALTSYSTRTLRFPVSGLMRAFTQGNGIFAIETVAASLPDKQLDLTKPIVAYAKTCLMRYVLNGSVPYCGISAIYRLGSN